MKDNNFNFNQVFLNTIDSKQLLSFLHLNNISVNISEKSLSILLAKASFAFLLISMLSYWFQMSFKSQKRIPFEEKRSWELIFSKGSPLTYVGCEADHNSKAMTYNKTDKKSFYYFLEKVPFVNMWFANITLALLLSIRWIESGHFPLSNLYESLIFLSWSLTVIHLFLENLFNKREQILGSEAKLPTAPTLTLGAITSPVALFTNAFATFSLPQEMQKVTVLVPALKSNWLIMHVSVMIISYAALLSGSLLAMAFLVIKFIDDNSLIQFFQNSIPSAARSQKAFSGYKGKGVPSIMSTFINYSKSLTQLMDRGLSFIRKQPQLLRNSSASYSSGFNKSISSTPNSTSYPARAFSERAAEEFLFEKKSFNSLRVPPASATLIGVSYPVKGKEFLGNSSTSNTERTPLPLQGKKLAQYEKYLPQYMQGKEGTPFEEKLRVRKKPLQGMELLKGTQSKEEELRSNWSSNCQYLGDHKLFSYSSGYQKSEVESSKPLLLRSLIKENKVLMDLPQILDNLSYRSIGLGFALLTIGILSGAVWANEAWGSYWSWDPKETWALITWLVFALYLHTRLSKGWVGKESALVASFGFIVIWFCYLGVNLFGKGLHSYGWFQQ